MLAINSVSKRFDNGTLALEDITANIATGEFVALLGPSGCGKSTLLRLIAGLEEASSGAIAWDEGKQPGPGDIGFVFQDATLLPWATAAENVSLPLRLKGRRASVDAALVRATLARVGLQDFAHTRPKGLSGGMKMRVSIARALVSDPLVLLMDEPFAALDEFTRHRLQEDLRALWRQSGKTILFVTHSIYEAAYLASRIIIMSPRPGRIATDLRSTVPEGSGRRICPEYTDLVNAVTTTLRQAAPE
jgi:NitT/TauT family transport system ATP-binding protein